MGPAQEDNTTAGRADASEVERLKQELSREHEMYLRAIADFENYRRRVDRDLASATYSGKRDIILPVLEALDGFDRALAHMADAPASVVQGVEAIYQNLLRTLGAQGVAPLNSVGEIFDPAVHEAVGWVQSDRYQPGVVADEVRRGYRLGDELLRPARVRVAQ